MSLLGEIQDASIDADVKLAVVLRKCAVLAVRLGHKDFGNWVDRELNGYQSQSDLPRYRISQCVAKGYFSGPFGSGLRNAPIPPACLPEKLRHFAETAYLYDGVSSYESLLRTGEHTFQIPWPADIILLMQSEGIYADMVLGQAWLEISSTAFVSLLDTVRNKVLKFALEIEAADPRAGEAQLGKPPLPQERVSQVFNTVIYGTGSTLAIGSKDFALTVQQNVYPNDLESLKKYLAAHGVVSEDLQELEAAIREDEKPKSPASLGRRVSEWIGKMTTKTLSGAWKVGAAATSDILVRAILAYYGLNR